YRAEPWCPPLRMVAELGSDIKYTAVLPTGQSGHPASPNYFDQFRLWYDGATRPPKAPKRSDLELKRHQQPARSRLEDGEIFLMSKIEDLLNDYRDDGTEDSSGAFTIDFQKAREKLAKFQLRDPHEFILKFIQAGNRAGGESGEIDINLGKTFS